MTCNTSKCPSLRQCATPRPVRRQHAARAWAAAAQSCSVAESEATTATVLEKADWQSSVRSLQGRRKHRLWEPVLQNPPPLLGDVCVVLVSPKRPISVGTVARSLSCFECEDLRIVQPRCDHLARSARNGSKGAQFLLWRAAQHDSLEGALADVDVAVACTRWVAGRPNACRSIAELLAAPQVAALLSAPVSSGTESGSSNGSSSGGSSSSSGDGSSSSSSSSSNGSSAHAEAAGQQQQQRRRKLALVFGREVEGLTPAEVDACDYTLSIPIGRLQESMSLSHAVSVVLSRMFELRQHSSGFALPQGISDLASGYQDSGVER